jgi:hypothetical protein
LIAVGAVILLLAGGLAAGPIASLAQGDPDAGLSEEDAIRIATDAYGGTADNVDLEREDGQPVYEVNLSNGTEVEVHGNSGDILEVEFFDDDDDDGDDDDDDGDIDDDDGEEDDD